MSATAVVEVARPHQALRRGHRRRRRRASALEPDTHPRPARPQRRRQDHADAAAHRAGVRRPPGEIRVFGEQPVENAGVLQRICFIKESQRYPDDFRVEHVSPPRAVVLPELGRRRSPSSWSPSSGCPLEAPHQEALARPALRGRRDRRAGVARAADLLRRALPRPGRRGPADLLRPAARGLRRAPAHGGAVHPPDRRGREPARARARDRPGPHHHRQDADELRGSRHHGRRARERRRRVRRPAATVLHRDGDRRTRVRHRRRARPASDRAEAVPRASNSRPSRCSNSSSARPPPTPASADSALSRNRKRGPRMTAVTASLPSVAGTARPRTPLHRVQRGEVAARQPADHDRDALADPDLHLRGQPADLGHHQRLDQWPRCCWRPQGFRYRRVDDSTSHLHVHRGDPGLLDHLPLRTRLRGDSPGLLAGQRAHLRDPGGHVRGRHHHPEPRRRRAAGGRADGVSAVYFGDIWWQRLLVFFFGLLFVLFVGSLFAAVWVRWKATDMIVLLGAIGLLVLGLIALTTLSGSMGLDSRRWPGRHRSASRVHCSCLRRSQRGPDSSSCVERPPRPRVRPPARRVPGTR